MFLKQNVILVRQVNSHSMGHHARLVPLEAIALKGQQSVLSALLDTSKCASSYQEIFKLALFINEGALEKNPK